MPYEWDSLIDLNAFDQLFEGVFDNHSITAEQILQNLIQGKEILNKDLIKQLFEAAFLSEWQSLHKMILVIIGILFVSAIIKCFCEVFAKQDLAEISSYVSWMILMGVILQGYLKTSDIARDNWQSVLTFMKMLAPAYLISIGSVAGVTTATCFYQLLLLLIGIVDTVLIGILIPFIHVLVILICMDNLLGGDQFHEIEELIQKGIVCSLKISFSMIAGIGFVKGILTPVIGSVNKTLLQRTLSVIPGIGDASNTITGAMTGSALLIKNTIGGFGLCALIFLTVIPLLRIGSIALGMKIAGAIGSVFGKNSLAKSTIRISDTCFVLARLTFSINALCFLMIAMTAYTTNVSI